MFIITEQLVRLFGVIQNYYESTAEVHCTLNSDTLPDENELLSFVSSIPATDKVSITVKDRADDKCKISNSALWMDEYDIFSRLNLGAVKLKDQEVRNCIYRGSFNDMLHRIARTDETVKALFHNTENKRMEYEERILRFFAMRDFYNVSGTLKDTMNKFMVRHMHDSPEEVAEFEEQYRSVADAIKQVLGKEAFFFQGERASKFNGAVYDSIIIPFSLFTKRDLIMHADAIRERIFYMKENDAEYRENVYVGTNAGRRVRGRITKVINIISECIGRKESEDEPRRFDISIRQELFRKRPICAICGNKILAFEDCEVDHIIPFSRGGFTTIENAQLTHRTCNRSKSDCISEHIESVIDTSDVED